MEVWAVFSIAKEYYQPDNNLIILYENKPSFEQLKELLYKGEGIEDLEDEQLISIVELLKGETFTGYSTYRLEKVKVGERLEQGEYY